MVFYDGFPVKLDDRYKLTFDHLLEVKRRFALHATPSVLGYTVKLDDNRNEYLAFIDIREGSEKVLWTTKAEFALVFDDPSSALYALTKTRRTDAVVGPLLDIGDQFLFLEQPQ